MRFPAARVAEHQHVFPAIQERAVLQRLDVPRRLRRQTLQIEIAERLFQRQLRLLQQAGHAVLAPLLTFEFDQFKQVPLIAHRFPFRLTRFFLKAAPEYRQVQIFETFRQRGLEVRCAHSVTFDPLPSSSSKLASETSSTSMFVAAGTAAPSFRIPAITFAFSFPSPISPCSSTHRRMSSTRASPSFAASSNISRYRLFARTGAVSRSASHAIRKPLVGNNSSR